MHLAKLEVVVAFRIDVEAKARLDTFGFPSHHLAAQHIVTQFLSETDTQQEGAPPRATEPPDGGAR